VSVVGRNQWSTKSGFGMNDALEQVPGVFAQSRYGTGDVRLTIRGFGARGAGDRSNSGTSRGVRVLVDGIPETEPDGRTSFDNVDMATIERVEVMRSNASTMWGNAAGGVVNFSTMPDGAAPLAEATYASGSFGLQRTAGRVGTTIADARVWSSAVLTEFDGWRAHSSTRRLVMNGGILAPLGDKSRLGVSLIGASNLFRLPGPLTQAQADADPSQANPTYATRDERRMNRTVRLGLTLDHALNDAQDLSFMTYVNPKYLQRSERGSFRDFTRLHAGGSALWRGAFGDADARHRVTVGADGAYQDGAILFYSLAADGTRGTTLNDNKGEGAQNVGAFVQDELALHDRLVLMVGARYDNIGYFYHNFITPAINASKRFSKVTPRAGISWRATPGSSVYASVGGGVEVPAGNEVDPAPVQPGSALAINPLLEPIVSQTVEAGTRGGIQPSSGLVRALSYDVALYTIGVTNEPVPYNGGRFYQTAGKVRRTGLEFAGAARFSAGFGARLTGTLSANKYDSYVFDSTYFGRPGFSQVLDGNKVAGLPSTVLNGALTFTPPDAEWLTLEVGATQTGSYYADDKNLVNVPGFHTVRTAVSVNRPLVGGVALRGFIAVENALDRRYFASAFINPDYVGGVPAAFEPGLPRAVIVSFSLARSR
jgi:iron complex outermembrane receptor protein